MKPQRTKKEAHKEGKRENAESDRDDWTQEDREPPQASLAHVLSGSSAGNKEEARYVHAEGRE